MPTGDGRAFFNCEHQFANITVLPYTKVRPKKA